MEKRRSCGLFSFLFCFRFSSRPRDTSATSRVTAAGISNTPPVIVVGFLGGFIKHDNLVHSEVQLAARLRKEYPAGVHVETFESYRGEKARQKILELLDADHDGTLTAEEKQDARIILYGHSWGASESITLARQLNRRHPRTTDDSGG